MKSVTTQARPSRAAKPYVDRINKQLRETVDSIIEIGKILTEAQGELDRNDWLNFVSYQLPFSRRTAEKLIKIAADRRLSNPRYRKQLPPHWTTLHELTFLDDDAFEQGIKDRKIVPDAERKDIAAMRQSTTPPRKPASRPKVVGSPQPPSPIGVSPPQRNNRAIPKPVDARLATISVQIDQLTADTVHALYRALGAVQKVAGVTVTEYAALKHADLLFDVRQRLRTNTEDFKQRSKDYDIQLIEDAFFQLETGKSFARLPDGSLAPNDIRNPKNEFHGMSSDELFDYCLIGQVCTKYTPLEFVDFQSRIDLLALTVLSDGNEDAAKEALAELVELSESSQEAKVMVDAINA